MIDSVSRPIDFNYAIHNGLYMSVCMWLFIHMRLFAESGYSYMSDLYYWLKLSENS